MISFVSSNIKCFIFFPSTLFLLRNGEGEGEVDVLMGEFLTMVDVGISGLGL